ncbi:MAG: hypothetical protein K5770_13875, partial [Lachnospiraceae bacterium]|nr:hypothetical protein [Lachnospiraceae bacterium]
MKRGLIVFVLAAVMLAGCGSNKESAKPAKPDVKVNDSRTTTEGNAGTTSTIVDNRQKDDPAGNGSASDEDFEKTGY